MRQFKPCTDCGRPMQQTATMAAKPVCLRCRRARRGLPPDARIRDLLAQRKQPTSKVCPECGDEFLTVRRIYCTDECWRRVRYRRGSGGAPRLSATRRGYGREHQKLRAELLPHAYDTPCCLCGELMLLGQKLHLDHTEDRSDYRGFAHAECNIRDAAARRHWRAA